MSTRERPAQQNNPCHREDEYNDQAEGKKDFGETGSYRANTRGLLPGNSME